MRSLNISVHEFKTAEGAFLGMNAGEFTGVYAPLPVSDQDQEGMKLVVQQRAAHYLSLKSDDQLTNGEDLSLAEIQESIRENIVEACADGVMSCPDCDGSGKCRGQSDGQSDIVVEG